MNKKIDIFEDKFLNPLSDVSFDDNNNIPLFIDLSENRYIDFDKKVVRYIYTIIKNEYKDFISCVDTIIKQDNKIFLIEFKNSPRDNIKKYSIWAKAIESLAILQKYSSIENLELVFMVVYNENKSKSYKKVGKAIKNLNNFPLDFGLQKYKSIVFDEIYTMDKNDFLSFKNSKFSFAKNWE